MAGDTDSFFLHCNGVSGSKQLLPAIKTEGLLDTSNFPATHPLYSGENANKIGMFKHESGGCVVYKEWVFLRPKCYSLLKVGDEASKKAKGVVRNIVSNKLMHCDYKRIYESLYDRDDDDGEPQPKVMRVDQRRIGSSNHQLYTMAHSKVALSATDDKRHWTSPNSSLPYGHHAILNQQQ